MEIAEHISTIGAEGQLFAEAADVAGFDATIDTCPGWSMRDLVRHLSEIHLWAAAHVAGRATKMWVDDLVELSVSWPDLAVFWPDDHLLIDMYLETNANLVRELQSAPSDLDAMTFLTAPSPLAMWARRQAHEISIHRFDAQFAARMASTFDPRFAADGIDELLMAFAPRATTFPIHTAKSMVVHAIDTDDRWHLTMAPDGIEASTGDGAADASLTGRAADLYLTLWNRRGEVAIEVKGDRDLLTLWQNGHRVRWS